METRRNNWSYKLIIRIGCSYIHYYTLMYNLCITVPEGSTNSEYWFSATKFIHLPTWHEEWIGTWQQPFEITGNNNFQGYVKATKKELVFINQDSLQSLLTSLLCLNVFCKECRLWIPTLGSLYILSEPKIFSDKNGFQIFIFHSKVLVDLAKT